MTLRATDGEPAGYRIVRILEDDGESKYITYGTAPEGAEPRRIARERVADVNQVGVVRDFLKFEPRMFGRDVWPWVFNIADSLLTVGVVILLLHLWVDQRRTAAGRSEGNQVPQT